MIRVVAAIIIDTARFGPSSSDPRVLAGRRTKPAALRGLWEFPGGKVEHGEDDVTALRREIREELGVAVQIDGPFGPELPMIGGPGVWQPYLARIIAGEPQLHDHDQLRWLAADELHEVPWLSSDGPILEPLAHLLRHRPGEAGH